MKKSILIIVALSVVVVMSAQKRMARVPATPHPILITQPNGDTLSIRLLGDEHYHYNTTLDGYVIVKNDKGYYCYAKVGKEGHFVPTKRVVHSFVNRTFCEKWYLKRIAKNEKLKKTLLKNKF